MQSPTLSEKFAAISPRDLLVVNDKKKFAVDAEQTGLAGTINLTGPRGSAALLMLHGERVTLVSGWGTSNREHRVSDIVVLDRVAS